MSIRYEIKQCIERSNMRGFGDISEFGIDVLEDLFLKLAKQMCDKQKQICYDEAETKDIGSGYYLYSIIDKESILNSPYPEELQ